MFQRAVDKDEAMEYKEVVGIDQQSLTRLLVDCLKTSKRVEKKVELHRWGKRAGLQFDDYTFLRKYDQSNSDYLPDTFEHGFQTVPALARTSYTEPLFDLDDHITVPNWSRLEKWRNAWEAPAQN